MNKGKSKEYVVKVYDEIPNGWATLKGASTSPVGYEWIYNRKSLFSKEYESALLKLKEE